MRAAVSSSLSQRLQASLARALGVSRVARITGLDRTGVEVACAVRPGGHVLQVCNGKGPRWEEAAAGALLETAELWAAERVRPEQLVWGSEAELEAAGLEAWPAPELGSAGGAPVARLWSRDVRLAWREASELHTGRPVLLPAQAVHCPPAGTPPLGPLSMAWTSNGSGAHPERARALLHALLEATERDQLSRTLPEGWTEEAIAERLLRPASLSTHAPRVAALVQRLEAAGFRAHLFDLSPPARTPGAVRLPVAGALLVDEEEGPVPLTAGYACALGREGSLLRALLEAAQSRLTDIHGAREDIAAADREAARALAQACAQARARAEVRGMPELALKREDPAAAVKGVLARLRAAGFEEVAALSLDAPVEGLSVVRVVVPGMQVSELL
ncbi:YcaO-like family protein [Aggregicoccus sp. 17bor-14]|uniref:YcaO-like family protein n=1 Tax=Myxococcaceae TaxID=31 RepID=UPI00351A7442